MDAPKPAKSADELHGLLSKFLKSVGEDVAVCNRYLLEGKDVAFWRRTKYRCVFATIEALASVLKQSAAAIAETDHSLLPEGHRLLLKDLYLAVDETGSPVERSTKAVFLSNVRFALKTYAQVTRCPMDLVFDKGWDALRASVKVRERIGNPRRESDTILSEEDMAQLDAGWSWFALQLGTVMQGSRYV